MSRFGRSRLRDAAYSALWAMAEEKLYAVLDFLDERAAGHTLSRDELVARGIRFEAARQFALDSSQGNQIQVLSLKGVIAHHAGMEMDISGGTSTEAFGASFDAAMANSAVGTIVINADSPGGAVEGVPELFGKIFAARGQKKIIAVCNAHMHSAAYWICAAADEIVVTPSGLIGDIGVMTVHTDTSKAEAKAGIKRTLIKAGTFKGEGAPFEPLSQEALDARLALVEDMYAMFAGDVARGRGDSIDAVKSGYGEGRSVTSRQAVKLGLADRVATFEQVIAELGGRAPSAATNRTTRAAVRAEAEPEKEVCPDCGQEMQDVDGEKVCPDCDAPEPAAAAELIRTAVKAGAITASAAPSLVPIVAAVAPPSINTLEIITPKPEASIMTPEEKEAALAAMRAEEKARQDAINALCVDHEVTAKATEFIAKGFTIDQVRAAILEDKKAKRGAVPGIHMGADREADRPFDNLGEQLQAIAAHFGGNTGRPVDKRLYAAVSSGGASANVGSDGGFMIQKEFTTELLESTIDGGDILGQADTHEVGANADGLEVVYLDETSRATGSRWGGVQVYRGAEADSATPKKPQFGKWEVRLEDIIGSAYMTERLLQDAPSIQNVFATGFMEEFRFTAENEMVRGTGVGQMYGILNAPGRSRSRRRPASSPTRSSRRTSQKMWRSCTRARARMARGTTTRSSRISSTSQIGTGTSAQLVYMPPGGLSGAKYGTINGRPCIPIEYASGAGDVGDIFFADWSATRSSRRAGSESPSPSTSAS
jgi:HK97 family phage major capsid protein